VKDALKEYALSFPPVSRLLEVNVDRTVYDQAGPFDGVTFERMHQM
jgi:hypothetical protein